MGVRRLLEPLEVWGMRVGRQETVGLGEPGDWDDGESGRNGEGATSLRSPRRHGEGFQSTSLERTALWWVKNAGQKALAA